MLNHLITRLEHVVIEIAVRLRSGDGLDRQQYLEATGLLRRISEVLASASAIPKSLARILLDINPSFSSVATLYNEPDRGEIYKAMDVLDSLVSECVSEHAPDNSVG